MARPPILTIVVNLCPVCECVGWLVSLLQLDIAPAQCSQSLSYNVKEVNLYFILEWVKELIVNKAFLEKQDPPGLFNIAKTQQKLKLNWGRVDFILS